MTLTFNLWPLNYNQFILESKWTFPSRLSQVLDGWPDLWIYRRTANIMPPAMAVAAAEA